jgi:thiol-disulfide isomerase/thioredoxin
MFSKIAHSGRVVLILLVVTLLGLLAVQACKVTYQSGTSDGQEATESTTNDEQKATVGVNVGELAPDFSLADLDGNQISLSDFRGETVFVNFWATWCPPCRAEMPEMEAIYQEYKNKDVVIIGIDVRETKGEVLQYVQANGYNWTFVLDTTGAVTGTYKVPAIPTSFFINREGIIQTVNIGPMTKRAMEIELAKSMN